MYTKYVDTKVILTACTKYTDYKSHAEQIIGGGIGGLNNIYNLKIPISVYERIRSIHLRRKNNYGSLYGVIDEQSCIGRMPEDFKGSFTKGSTNDYCDDDHLATMYEQIIDGIPIHPIEKFDEKTAKEFCYRVYSSLRSNSVRLGLIIKMLSEEEIIFQDDDPGQTKKLYTEIMKGIDDHRYKKDVQILSECIVNGINSGIEFDLIVAEPFFYNEHELRKVYTCIKRVFKHPYNDFIFPLYQSFGPNKPTVFNQIP
jgi:hypothetical protein